MATKQKLWRSAAIALVYFALFCTCAGSVHAAGTLYARAIGEPPPPQEPDVVPSPPPRAPQRAPAPARKPEPVTPEPAAKESEGVSRSTIWIGVGIAAALAALAGGGGGGSSGTSH